MAEAIMDFSAFKTVRELGSGYRDVELFEHGTDGGKIVMKYLRVDAEFKLEQVVREVQILLRLNHPSIIRIIGWWLPNEECSQMRIATEFMSNGSLDDVFYQVHRGEAPSWWTHENISILIADILDGLRYMHSQGVVHRDVRPDHILIDSECRARIGGFGICGPDDSGSTIRTAAYMATEVFEGTVPTEKVDVFAFGLILYEILVGDSVFPRDGALLRTVEMHIKDFRPVIPEWIHPIVRTVIGSCWSRDPEKRPTFEDIYGLLEGIDFGFYSDVNTEVIRRRLGDGDGQS
jgi:serine/threonine protein kinase